VNVTSQNGPLGRVIIRTGIGQRLLSLSRPPATDLLGLGLAVACVLALQATSVWRDATAGIEALGFDSSRAAMIAAWIAGIAVAGTAAAFTRRVWPAVACASGFTLATYVLPWSIGAIQSPPVLFGVPEILDAAALLYNAAIVMATVFVLSIPFAGTGQVLAQMLLRVVRAAGVRAGSESTGNPAVNALGLVLVLVCVTVVLRGIDPLLRYGPEQGVYLPASRAALPAVGSPAIAPSSACPVRPASPSSVVSRAFYSNSMGQNRAFDVYLPPGYSTYTRLRYPVLYLLHGDPGRHRDWINFGVQKLLDAGIASGSLPPVIAVMPDGNGKVSSAAEWANRWDGRDPVEQSVLELMGLVDREYRTTPDRQDRIIAGLSSGGFGATNLAARHPDMFGAAISLSGYFVAQGPVFGGDRAYMRANSPLYVVQDKPASSPRFVLVVGDRDGYFTEAARQFDAELSRLKVKHDLVLLPGAHSWTVWVNGLAIGLERIKPMVSAPTGSGSTSTVSNCAYA
jgi:enterochelin esterase-like enzyme